VKDLRQEELESSLRFAEEQFQKALQGIIDARNAANDAEEEVTTARKALRNYIMNKINSEVVA
jgi:hypothetical protein